MKYVIIGNGVASVGAIEGIRKFDAEGTITVISEEGCTTYGRPLISYYLAGKIGPERLPLRPESFYTDNKVTLKLGSKVTSIDRKGKKVVTDDGKKTAYDRLLIATGGTPFYPPIAGCDGADVYSFTTLAHAAVLNDLAPKIKKAVVVGGGLIGLKAAESLHDRGVEVSIVELAPRVLSAAFDDAAGGIVARRLEEVGVKIFCRASAKEIKRDKKGRVSAVLLSTGQTLKADIVVVAVGVAANTGLAKEAGLKVNRGIVVDDRLMTSLDGVYAAGDVAEGQDMTWGDARVVPIWPNAHSQGYYAGKNMAGGDIAYPGGLGMNAIGFYGLPTTSCGIVNPPEDAGFEISAWQDGSKYRKLVFKDGKLVGCVLVGDIDKAGLYTSFIRFGLPVTAQAKEELMAGRPTTLLWPDDFFEQTWKSQAGKTA